MRKTALLLVPLLLAATSLLSAQTPATTSAPATIAPANSDPAVLSDPSKEARIWQHLVTRIRMEADGTGTRTTEARARIQAPAAVKEMAVLKFAYTAMNQQIDIEHVQVTKPDGSIVVTPAYNVQDLPAAVSQTAPMYSDVHEKHVTVKALGVGDILELKTTQHTLKPEAPGEFWLEYSFIDHEICEDEELEVDVPTGKSVIVHTLGTAPSIEIKDGRTIYRWKRQNLTRPDPEKPTKTTRYWKPDVQVTSFKDWAAVGVWYHGLEQESLKVTPEIQARADKLTKGLTTREEKIHALYNAVALGTHYVGLSFGIGRYQPHAAEDVLENEYGDCKDKHTLLATLLKAEGIESWAALISTTRHVDETTPSPAQFNHVITVIPEDGKLRWMDTTTEVMRMGDLASTLLDSEALIVPSNSAAKIEKTPLNEPEPVLFHFQSSGTLDVHGHFNGHLEESIHGGWAEMSLRNAFRQTPEAQWKELLERVMHGQSFGGDVTNPKIDRPDEIDPPFHMAMDYDRDKYYQWKDTDETHWIDAPSPPMGGELGPGIKQTKPFDDPTLGPIGQNLYEASITLPAGWSIQLQPNVDLVEDWLEYHAHYEFENGTLRETRKMVIKKNYVPLADWDKYLEFRRALYLDENHNMLVGPESILNPKVKKKHGIF